MEKLKAGSWYPNYRKREIIKRAVAKYHGTPEYDDRMNELHVKLAKGENVHLPGEPEDYAKAVRGKRRKEPTAGKNYERAAGLREPESEEEKEKMDRLAQRLTHRPPQFD